LVEVLEEDDPAEGAELVTGNPNASKPLLGVLEEDPNDDPKGSAEEVVAEVDSAEANGSLHHVSAVAKVWTHTWSRRSCRMKRQMTKGEYWRRRMGRHQMKRQELFVFLVVGQDGQLQEGQEDLHQYQLLSFLFLNPDRGEESRREGRPPLYFQSSRLFFDLLSN
jgi:hypothetical protein